MPRAPTITQADVNAICDRLAAVPGGKPPSVRKIIEIHGSGGQGTVYRLFEHWQSRQERPAGTSAALSPMLQKALLEFINRETAHARADLDSQLADSKQSASDLATENDHMVSEIERQNEEILRMSEGLAGLQGRLDQLERDLLAAHGDTVRERAEAQSARTELAVALLKLEAMPRLEADLAALRGECDKERQARIVAEQGAAVALAQRDDKAERLDEEKARSAQLVERLTQELAIGNKLTAELGGANIRVEAGNARLEAALRELVDLRDALRASRSEALMAGEALAELHGAAGKGKRPN